MIDPLAVDVKKHHESILATRTTKVPIGLHQPVIFPEIYQCFKPRRTDQLSKSYVATPKRL